MTLRLFFILGGACVGQEHFYRLGSVLLQAGRRFGRLGTFLYARMRVAVNEEASVQATRSCQRDTSTHSRAARPSCWRCLAPVYGVWPMNAAVIYTRCMLWRISPIPPIGAKHPRYIVLCRFRQNMSESFPKRDPRVTPRQYLVRDG